MRYLLWILLCCCSCIVYPQKRNAGPRPYLTQAGREYLLTAELSKATGVRITDTSITITGFFIMIYGNGDTMIAENEGCLFQPGVKARIESAKPGDFIIIGNINCNVNGYRRVLAEGIVLQVRCEEEITTVSVAEECDARNDATGYFSRLPKKSGSLYRSEPLFSCNSK